MILSLITSRSELTTLWIVAVGGDGGSSERPLSGTKNPGNADFSVFAFAIDEIKMLSCFEDGL